MYLTEQQKKERINESLKKYNRECKAVKLINTIDSKLKQLQELGYSVTFNTTASVREQIREENTYTIKN